MMMRCRELVALAAGQEADEWACRAVDDNTVLLISPRYYSDGDAIELLVKRSEGGLILSDGGEAVARLEMSGINIDAGRMREAWMRLLRSNQVEYRNGRITLRGSSDDAGFLIRVMLDTLAGVDGLRALAPIPRDMPFSDKLVTLLRAEFPKVQQRPDLRGESGTEYRLTAAAGTDDRLVYVQAVAGNSAPARKTAVEHAYTAFSDVNGTLARDRKLVIVNDQSTPSWSTTQLRLLSSVAYVGTWNARDRFTSFIRGKVPVDRLMAEQGDQLTAM
ncbi:DUF1828 domain-containing protein [Nucisporomicrobium flavum]|uniref:DUF1828 domain-containing protein n=1 Tax=Nucisporomicrobium flavum TaxID=2785915 RepID=UPI001F1880D6|nr:DUF1828 domain-containing protein [Nucisporomicrobium flavum]